MNADSNYIRTVDFVSFLKTVFINWRRMAVLGIICAVLLGMLPVYEYKTKSRAASESAAAREEEADKYITSEEYNASLKDLEQKLDSKKQYLIKSLLMKIDPFNEVMARKFVYVDMFLDPDQLEDLNDISDLLGTAASSGTESNSDETLVNEPSEEKTEPEEKEETRTNVKVQYLLSRVMSDYEYFLKTRIDWEPLAGELGTESKYLDECLNVDTYVDQAKIVICVKSYDKDVAEKILDYVEEKLSKEQKDIEERFSSHDLVIQDGGCEIAYDALLKNYQENFISELATTQTRYDNYQSARSDYVYNPPARTKLNKKAILVNAVIGFFGGFLLVFAFGALRIFAKGRVISAKEMAMSYDVKTLAEIPSSGGKRLGAALDRWIENIGLGAEKTLSEEERYKKAAQMIELYALDAEKIILTGDVDDADLQTAAERLKKHLPGVALICCETLLGSTAELKESDGVILIEKRNQSGLNEIETDLGIINEINIPVIGTILL